MCLYYYCIFDLLFYFFNLCCSQGPHLVTLVADLHDVLLDISIARHGVRAAHLDLRVMVAPKL